MGRSKQPVLTKCCQHDGGCRSGVPPMKEPATAAANTGRSKTHLAILLIAVAVVVILLTVVAIRQRPAEPVVGQPVTTSMRWGVSLSTHLYGEPVILEREIETVARSGAEW